MSKLLNVGSKRKYQPLEKVKDFKQHQVSKLLNVGSKRKYQPLEKVKDFKQHQKLRIQGAGRSHESCIQPDLGRDM